MANFSKKFTLNSALMLYPIIESSQLKVPLELFLEEIFAAGVRIVQVREKSEGSNSKEETAFRTKEVIERFKERVLLIIDDDLDLALKVRADGIHVGKNDIKPEKVRQIKNDLIIGYSCNDEADIIEANKYADYAGIGPYNGTKTKKDHRRILGEEGIKDILNKVEVPSVIIGGIDKKSVEDIFSEAYRGYANLSGVALSSYLLNSKKPYNTAREILELVRSYNLLTNKK